MQIPVRHSLQAPSAGDLEHARHESSRFVPFPNLCAFAFQVRAFSPVYRPPYESPDPMPRIVRARSAGTGS